MIYFMKILDGRLLLILKEIIIKCIKMIYGGDFVTKHKLHAASICTAVALLLTSIPLTAAAASSDFLSGEGTAESPYLISNKQHLNNMRNALGAHFRLVSNIVFYSEDFTEGGAFYQNGTGWVAVGSTQVAPFTGTFNGDGHTIQGLQSSQMGNNLYVGLFGYNKGTISDVGIANGSLKALRLQGSENDPYVGGIAGYNEGTIERCYNTSAITGNGYTGGITGYNSGSIANCFDTGSISMANIFGSPYAGGIAGYNAASGSITNVYDTGTVVGGSRTGGMVGGNQGALANCYYMDFLPRGSGTVLATPISLESMKQADIFAGFDFDRIWGIDGSAAFPFPTLRSIAYQDGVEDTQVFAGGNGYIHNPYRIQNKQQLNSVRQYRSSAFVLESNLVFDTADFQAGGPFYNSGAGWAPIGTSESNAFAGAFDGNGHTIQGLKIQASGVLYVGLFGYNRGFVSNLTLTDASLQAADASCVGGIAGRSDAGNLMNCHFSGTVVVNTSSDANVGGIVGSTTGKVTDCWNTGSVTVTNKGYAYIWAGGIAGFKSGGVFENCSNGGTVSGTAAISTNVSYGVFLGGIVGRNDSGAIRNSCNTEDISASLDTSFTGRAGYAGGITGYNGGTVERCYNTASVQTTGDDEAYAYAGGIVGYGQTISDAYNTGTISALSEVNSCAGGIAGSGGGTNLYNVGIVTASCSRPTATDTNAYAGAIFGAGNYYAGYYSDFISKGTGKPAESSGARSSDEMKLSGTYAGFDFGSVWELTGRQDYPFPTLRAVHHVGSAENTPQFAGGNGAAYNPYQITTKQQLNNMRLYRNAAFQLQNDIVFTDGDFAGGGDFYNTGAGWSPVGASDAEPFLGMLDGDGCTVCGLRVNLAGNTVAYAGLFGYCRGIIRRLGVVDADVRGSTSRAYIAYTGGIAGFMDGGEISECYFTGTVRATATNTSAGAYAGGLVGYSRAVIKNSYNTGDVAASAKSVISQYAGGIAGLSAGEIAHCYNIGKVTLLLLPDASGSIKYGAITGAGAGSGLTDCYYLSTTLQGVGNSQPQTGTTACTAQQMWNRATYKSFDFDSVWQIGLRGDYAFPDLRRSPHVAVAENTQDFAGGKGTPSSPYQIATKAHLDNIRQYPGACFQLTANIVFAPEDFASGGAYDNAGAGWRPLGADRNHAFVGMLDGNGHTVENLRVHVQGTVTLFAGLIGCNRGTVRNLQMAGGTVDATKSVSSYTVYAGSIAAYNEGHIENCGNTGTVSTTSVGYSNAGGIIGYSSGTVADCVNTGAISSQYYSEATRLDAVPSSGGIVGCNEYGVLTRCVNQGDISGYAYAGGIAGVNYNSATLAYSYNTAAVSAGFSAGGIAGASAAVILNCYNTGPVRSDSIWSARFDTFAGGLAGGITGEGGGTLSNCYNIGAVTARPDDSAVSASYVGGIVGSNYDGTITNSYGMDTVSSGVGLQQGEGQGVLYSAEELRSIASYAGFDFDSVWEMDSYRAYPYPQLSDNRQEKIAGISLLTTPEASPLETIEGIAPNLSGATAELTYADGVHAMVPVTGQMLSYDKNRIGQQTVFLQYGGKSSASGFPLTVFAKTLTGVSIKTMPAKTTYVQGQPLDLAGGELLLQYNNNSSSVVSMKDATIADDPEGTGNQIVKLRYLGFEVELPIQVQAKQVKTLTILSEPTKLSYLEGEFLDLTGACIKAVFISDDSYSLTLPVTQDMVSGYDSTPGIKTVTITYLGATQQFTVIVAARELTRISITSPPSKTSYFEGDHFDTGGMVVTAYYNNNTSETIENYTVPGAPLTVGQTSVTILYQNKSAVVPVTVSAIQLVRIEVTPPRKTTYIEGQALDTAGMVVTAYYNNGGNGAVTAGLTIRYDFTAPGMKTVTVEYGGQSDSFTVMVQPKSVEAIALKTPPAKQTYVQGEAFSVTGAAITVQYNNGTSSDIAVTSAMCSSFDGARVGTQTITITYSGKQTTFQVTVQSRVPSTITSGNFNIGNGSISKITAGTTVAQLLAGLNEREFVRVYNGSTEVSGDTRIVTGMTVTLKDGDTVKQTWIVIVTGDTNGDGDITITDMLAVKAHLLNKTPLSGASGTAADTNGDGGISITDFIQVKAHILGKESIQGRAY